ncbi:hypothetical protein L227DRAFT_650319 [Lentinus tigrinus ALCF2SS1-6]|uniref:Velvet domain-containing protein n=1 Tax=Lentinus tigrinus ALCF2SS1-6 TaxID=1328759 RepID=A0A5C2SJQ4_9APHY|nr:hypothetical protein L227DRAFT_650319 [Lentinus tigrinus ALCF2SS1-6]
MATSKIAVPFAYQFGPFAGRIMRASLEEMQKANIGRKYARKDKRPLDPPPVIRLRCYKTIQTASGHKVDQEIRDLDEQLVFGFLCHAELIQLPVGMNIEHQPVEARPTCRSAMPQDPNEHDTSPPTHNLAQSARPAFVSAGFDNSIHGTAGLPFGTRRLSLGGYDSGPMSFDSAGRTSEPWPMGRNVHSSLQQQRSATLESLTAEEVEDAMCMNLLAGETFVPCSLVEYEGRRAAMFVFSDLAVRQEGRFIIRYRVFNICGTHAGTPGVPILAECYGGSFEIFSTKTFPGLPASTDLTKRLSLSGIRVNSRHHQRRGWKQPASQSHSSASPTSSAQGNPVHVLGPSPALFCTPDRNQPQYTPSFSNNFSFVPLPQQVGLFGPDDAARNALAEWQRRELLRGDLTAGSRDQSSGSATDESGSARTLW